MYELNQQTLYFYIKATNFFEEFKGEIVAYQFI